MLMKTGYTGTFAYNCYSQGHTVLVPNIALNWAHTRRTEAATNLSVLHWWPLYHTTIHSHNSFVR